MHTLIISVHSFQIKKSKSIKIRAHDFYFTKHNNFLISIVISIVISIALLHDFSILNSSIILYIIKSTSSNSIIILRRVSCSCCHIITTWNGNVYNIDSNSHIVISLNHPFCIIWSIPLAYNCFWNAKWDDAVYKLVKSI